MGNVSGNSSGLRRYEDEGCSMDVTQDMPVESYHEQEATVYHPQNHHPVAFLSPVAFTSPVLSAPLQVHQLWMQNQHHNSIHSSIDEENLYTKKRIPTMIVWTHGGMTVAIEGSWDNWTRREHLEKAGDDFVIVKLLDSGVYHYRFAVNGRWSHDENLPWAKDDMGRVCNILAVQDYVPEAIESRTVLEAPPSPESSYDNTLDGSFYAKDPPLLPPLLHTTVLNIPQPATYKSLQRPPHTILEHLYVQETRDNPPILALGSTQRFREKYVTVELYRPSRELYN